MGPQTSREAPPIECGVHNVHAFEQYMHDCGLYGIEDMRPVNELRMKARWKMGAALAKVTRALGNNQYGSRAEPTKRSYRDFLVSLRLDLKLALHAHSASAPCPTTSW
jgi:hypothetical protein